MKVDLRKIEKTIEAIGPKFTVTDFVLAFYGRIHYTDKRLFNELIERQLIREVGYASEKRTKGSITATLYSYYK